MLFPIGLKYSFDDPDYRIHVTGEYLSGAVSHISSPRKHVKHKSNPLKMQLDKNFFANLAAYGLEVR